MLTAAQHEAVDARRRPAAGHRRAPAPARRRVLVERFALARRRGRAAARALPRAHARRPPTRCASASRTARRRPTRSSPVTTFQGFCARLLRDEALEAGVDPFAAPVTPADRLAMLLERIDELPLRRHDLRGNPSALLGSIVAPHRPAQGRAGHRARTTRLGGDAAEDASARAREREFAALYAAHDRMLAEAGDARLRRPRAARVPAAARAPARPRAARGALPPRAGRRAPGHELRPGPAAAAAGRRARQRRGAGDDDQAIHRFRGAATQEPRDFQADWPDATVVRLEQSLPLRARGSSRGRAVGRAARTGSPRSCAPRRSARARSRSGAARTSARRRRRSPPTSSG